MALMGLDVGSTGCKAVVFDVAGNQLTRAYREYPEIYPQAGWIELDPARVWQSVKEVIAEAAAAVTEPVRALSISAMGETFTPVARDGNFLYNSIVSPDSRAVPQARALDEALGAERIFQITGMPAHPSFTLPKIAWMAQERPEVHQQVWKYLLWPDLIYYKLGLEPRLDYSLAGRTMAFDVVNKCWSEEMLEGLNTPEARRAAGVSSPGPDTGNGAAGIRPLHTDLFAAPIKSGEVVGELSAAMASELGLPTGCLVVAGGHDQPMNALGAGIIKEGLAVDGMGTVECITVAFEQPVLNEAMRRHNYCCYPHVALDLYCSIAFNYSSGSVLRWYRDNFCAAQKQQAEAAGQDVYDLILADLPAGPTKLFTIPYFAGSGTPYLDPLARGAVFGLTLSCDDKTFVKGLLEGTCYEINLNIVSLAAAGVSVDRLRVTGGGSRSPLWLQLKADITGKEIVTLNVSESGCLAGAMLGGVATGEFASLAEATEALVHEKESYTPNAAQHAQYQDLYAIYAQLWPAVRDLVRSG
jgi:xylulokinase